MFVYNFLVQLISEALQMSLFKADPQVAQEYAGVPLLVVGDFSAAAASSDDRRSNGLEPYDEENKRSAGCTTFVVRGIVQFSVTRTQNQTHTHTFKKTPTSACYTRCGIHAHKRMLYGLTPFYYH